MSTEMHCNLPSSVTNPTVVLCEPKKDESKETTETKLLQTFSLPRVQEKARFFPAKKSQNHEWIATQRRELPNCSIHQHSRIENQAQSCECQGNDLATNRLELTELLLFAASLWTLKAFPSPSFYLQVLFAFEAYSKGARYTQGSLHYRCPAASIRSPIALIGFLALKPQSAHPARLCTQQPF